MDHLLQRVVGSTKISLLDGFSGYNQILVHPNDQDKIAFTTPWGTFYFENAFWIKKCGGHLSKSYGNSFCNEIHDFLVIYLDDIIVFSKSDKQHLDHLRQVFFKCRKYGISLNPREIHC